MIRKSIDMLEVVRRQEGHRLGQPGGGVHPGDRGPPEAEPALSGRCDVTYADLPIKIHTPHGPIAGVPTTDFSDNRVLRASSRDLFDVHQRHVRLSAAERTDRAADLVIHCQFGGRPLITAVLTELLKYMQKSRDVWFATHEELARLGAQARTSTSTAFRAGISGNADPGVSGAKFTGSTALSFVRDLVRKPVPTFRDHAFSCA